MNKTRVALITVWFPPNNGVAVNRMAAFAKYLSKEYDVEVFTLGKDTKNDASLGYKIHYLNSNSIISKFEHKNSDGKLVHTLKTFVNILFLKLGMSKYSAWKGNALSSFEKCHLDNPFDVVISSFAPVEAHEIVYAMKLKGANFKWIADMRDEMSLNPFASPSIRSFLKTKEEQYAPYIDAICSVSAPILQDFKELFPKVKFFAEVRNGYDHDIAPEIAFNDNFTIVFAGTFYGKIKPDVFFKALVELRNENKIADDFRIQFIGTSHNFTIPNSVSEFIEFIPKVPYLQAVEYMKKADCNLLICPPMGSLGRYTGKLFDYLSVEKPILAIIEKQDVGATLIEEHQAGFIAEFGEHEEIKKALFDVYTLWKDKRGLPYSHDKTLSLHRKIQVDKLKDLIETLVDS